MSELDPSIQAAIENADIQVMLDDYRADRVSHVEDLSDQLKAMLLSELLDGGTAGLALTSTAGYITIYNRATHEPSQTTYDQLEQRLRQRFPKIYPDYPEFAGQRVYQRQALEPIQHPLLPCPLHLGHSDRAIFDEMGFPYCPKYLRGPLNVERHLRRSHKMAWEMRENAKTEKREAETRAFQLAQLEAMQSLAAAGGKK